MGWFGRRKGGDRHGAGADEHPVPVEIDLGMQKAFEVEMVVGSLEDEGCRVYLVAQNEIAKPDALWPKHCRVLVHADDESRARAVFAAAGFL